jgi:hypothetical protein
MITPSVGRPIKDLSDYSAINQDRKYKEADFSTHCIFLLDPASRFVRTRCTSKIVFHPTEFGYAS